MITWIGPVILMTAAIVPADPRKMLVAGLIRASMDPIGMLVARAAGVYRFDSVLDTPRHALSQLSDGSASRS